MKLDILTRNTVLNYRPKAPTVEEAIIHAIDVLADTGEHEHMLAARVLLMVLDQRGCDHLDTGARNTGRLVDAISVIVVG